MNILSGFIKKRSTR